MNIKQQKATKVYTLELGNIKALYKQKQIHKALYKKLLKDAYTDYTDAMQA